VLTSYWVVFCDEISFYNEDQFCEKVSTPVVIYSLGILLHYRAKQVTTIHRVKFPVSCVRVVR